MALIRLSEEQGTSSSKPYLEDYYKSNGDSILETPSRVIEIIFVEKGAIIVTEDYSTFVFRSTQDCKNLKDALPLWIKDKGNKLAKYLVSVPYMGEYKGKAQVKQYLAIDDELQGTWVSKKQDTFSVDPVSIIKDGGVSLNPLLKKSK